MIEPGQWAAFDEATEKAFDKFREHCAEDMVVPVMLIMVDPQTQQVFYIARENSTPEQLMALVQTVGGSLYHTMHHHEG